MSVFKDTSIVIYHSPKQLGLIHARSVGIDIAKGPVVMVMDIHFEVQPHWCVISLFICPVHLPVSFLHCICVLNGIVPYIAKRFNVVIVYWVQNLKIN